MILERPSLNSSNVLLTLGLRKPMIPKLPIGLHSLFVGFMPHPTVLSQVIQKRPPVLHERRRFEPVLLGLEKLLYLLGAKRNWACGLCLRRVHQLVLVFYESEDRSLQRDNIPGPLATRAADGMLAHG